MEITFKLGRRQKTNQKKKKIMILVTSAMERGCCFTRQGLSEERFEHRVLEEAKKRV